LGLGGWTLSPQSYFYFPSKMYQGTGDVIDGGGGASTARQEHMLQPPAPGATKLGGILQTANGGYFYVNDYLFRVDPDGTVTKFDSAPFRFGTESFGPGLWSSQFAEQNADISKVENSADELYLFGSRRPTISRTEWPVVSLNFAGQVQAMAVFNEMVTSIHGSPDGGLYVLTTELNGSHSTWANLWALDRSLTQRMRIGRFLYFKGAIGHALPKLEVMPNGGILVANRDWGIYSILSSASASGVSTLYQLVNGAEVGCSSGNINSLVALSDGRIAWGGDNSDGVPRVKLAGTEPGDENSVVSFFAQKVFVRTPTTTDQDVIGIFTIPSGGFAQVARGHAFEMSPSGEDVVVVGKPIGPSISPTFIQKISVAPAIRGALWRQLTPDGRYDMGFHPDGRQMETRDAFTGDLLTSFEYEPVTNGQGGASRRLRWDQIVLRESQLSIRPLGPGS
jgi:hypothetical protein